MIHEPDLVEIEEEAFGGLDQPAIASDDGGAREAQSLGDSFDDRDGIVDVLVLLFGRGSEQSSGLSRGILGQEDRSDSNQRQRADVVTWWALQYLDTKSMHHTVLLLGLFFSIASFVTLVFLFVLATDVTLTEGYRERDLRR
jgi:hypothetical protein